MAGDNHKSLQTSASEAVAKSGLDGVRAEVVLVLDVSRSMFPLYRAKIVQELVPQFCALALNFDDDGVIPAYAFGDTPRHLRDLRATDFSGWVDREVIRTGSDYQQHCRYSPVIHDVCRYYFPEDWDRPALKETVGRLFKKEQVVYPRLSAPRAYPVFCMFVTGGDCEDEEATADAIRRSSRLPIFWQFIGLSPQGRLTPFRFLKRLDKLGNTHVDNCGFFEPGDVRNSQALFRGLLNELPEYLQRPEVHAMLDAEDGLETRGARPELDDAEARLDAITAMAAEPAAPAEPSVIITLPPELEEERDLDALRQKFVGIEWSEGTGAGGAIRAAAPMAKADEQPAESNASRRRLRPSELNQPVVAQKEDAKARVQDRLAALKSRLSDYQVEREDTAAPAHPAPLPLPRPQPGARVQTPSVRPQPPPRPTPAANTPPPDKVDLLRAKLAALGDDGESTIAATGDVVDQEQVRRPQPPARPQPPPRRPTK